MPTPSRFDDGVDVAYWAAILASFEPGLNPQPTLAGRQAVAAPMVSGMAMIRSRDDRLR